MRVISSVLTPILEDGVKTEAKATFLGADDDRTRGNGYKLQEGRFR